MLVCTRRGDVLMCWPDGAMASGESGGGPTCPSLRTGLAGRRCCSSRSAAARHRMGAVGERPRRGVRSVRHPRGVAHSARRAVCVWVPRRDALSGGAAGGTREDQERAGGGGAEESARRGSEEGRGAATGTFLRTPISWGPATTVAAHRTFAAAADGVAALVAVAGGASGGTPRLDAVCCTWQAILKGNPLMAKAATSSVVQRRWDDDVVFKNQVWRLLCVSAVCVRVSSVDRTCDGIVRLAGAGREEVEEAIYQ